MSGMYVNVPVPIVVFGISTFPASTLVSTIHEIHAIPIAFSSSGEIQWIPGEEERKRCLGP